MRYMLLIYTREDAVAAASPEEMATISNGHVRVMDEARSKGVLQGAEPLAPTTTATTVRLQNGKTMIIDGPFAETKEQLAGFYMMECGNLDEAIEWAKKIPTSCKGGEGCIEIRPIAELKRQA